MRKMTQVEFDALQRDAHGYKHIPSETDCTEVGFHGEHKLIFGNWCTLGNMCKLGNWCKLDIRCTLGESALYKIATFEGGGVQNGLHVTVGQIGRENRVAYFYIDENGSIFVRAGCWFSDLDRFVVRVKKVHGGTIYEIQYLAACEYAKAVLPAMLKERIEDDAK